MTMEKDKKELIQFLANQLCITHERTGIGHWDKVALNAYEILEKHFNPTHSYKIDQRLIKRIYMVLNPPQTIEQFIEVCVDYQLGIIERENEVFKKKNPIG